MLKPLSVCGSNSGQEIGHVDGTGRIWWLCHHPLTWVQWGCGDKRDKSTRNTVPDVKDIQQRIALSTCNHFQFKHLKTYPVCISIHVYLYSNCNLYMCLQKIKWRIKILHFKKLHTIVHFKTLKVAPHFVFSIDISHPPFIWALLESRIVILWSESLPSIF